MLCPTTKFDLRYQARIRPVWRSADSVRQAWVCALDASGHTYRKTLFEDSAGKRAPRVRESLIFQRLRRTPSSP